MKKETEDKVKDSEITTIKNLLPNFVGGQIVIWRNGCVYCGNIESIQILLDSFFVKVNWVAERRTRWWFFHKWYICPQGMHLPVYFVENFKSVIDSMKALVLSNKFKRGGGYFEEVVIRKNNHPLRIKKPKTW